MAKVVQIDGVGRLITKLKAMIAKARRENVTYIVGFTAAYAIYVHEDMTARHAAGTRAKYLEEPARGKQHEMRTIVKEGMRRGLTLSQAILQAALYLLGEAQSIVPVDTGNLRASGFVRRE